MNIYAEDIQRYQHLSIPIHLSTLYSNKEKIMIILLH